MRKTPEEVREECALVAEDLEKRWRKSAAELLENYQPALFGNKVKRDADAITAAANGLKAVATIIRQLKLEKNNA